MKSKIDRLKPAVAAAERRFAHAKERQARKHRILEGVSGYIDELRAEVKRLQELETQINRITSFISYEQPYLEELRAQTLDERNKIRGQIEAVSRTRETIEADISKTKELKRAASELSILFERITALGDH